MDSSSKTEIEALIPHRDPFLLVDRIVDRGENTITTEFHARPDLDAFRGHFPGSPILPGVLISEFVFQSSAILVSGESDGLLPVLTRIENARFRRVVRPGETLRAKVTLEDAVGAARYMSARVECEEETVLRIKFVVAAVPESETVR